MTDAPTTPDPIEIAMEAEAAGRAPGGVAARVLAKQEQLLGWQVASERAGFALKVLVGVAGLALVVALATMAWSARQADGLVVEPFLVPPDLARQGITGEIVARQVLDRLAELDRAANALYTVRVSDSWSQATRIQVPQTGVSLDEVQRLLRRWLGHETYVSGEITPSPAGLQLKARTGAGATIAVDGAAAALPDLSRQAADGIFARARPNAFAELLIRKGDNTAAKPILSAVLRSSDDARDRAWASNLMGVIAVAEDRDEEALSWYRRAMTARDPLLASSAARNASSVLATLGRSRESDEMNEAALRLIGPGRSPRERQLRAIYRVGLLIADGDYQTAERLLRPFLGVQLPGAFEDNELRYAQVLARLHRTREAWRWARSGGIPEAQAVAASMDDWARFLVGLDVSDGPHGDPRNNVRGEGSRVLALASLGRLEEARAIAPSLRRDCTVCLAAMGTIASREGDFARADREFAAARALHPTSIYTARYEALEALRSRRWDVAVERARAANRLHPRFGDFPEFWGEALLGKGDAKGAAAKFAQAEPLAPQWGRLHLKWGEALAKLGRTDEAKAHWRTAATLDLTDAERAELAQVSR